jgi:imidazolonepropionase-like amidohydrolase
MILMCVKMVISSFKQKSMTKKIFYLIALLISFSAHAQTAITDVTIVDVANSRLVSHQSVLIEGSTIIAIVPSEKFKIPKGATIISGANKFLVPGLIDAHAHTWDGDMYTDDGVDLTSYKPFQEAIDQSKARLGNNYKRFLQCGITTIIAPGTTINTLKITDSLLQQGLMPRVYMAGKLITVSNFGNPHNLPAEDEYFDFAANAEAAKQIVQNQIKLHPSFIKILFVPDLTWSHIEDSAKAKYPIVKAIVEEAHKNGLKVAVHATEAITAQLAVEAGCDYLAHGIHDKVVSDEFIRLLKQKQIIFCPTSNVEYPILRTFTGHPSFTSYELLHADPYVVKTFFDLEDLDSVLFRNTKKAWEASKGIFRRDSIRLINLKKLSDAGVSIVAGTDVGSLGNLPGTSYLPELVKMKESGMTNWQILKAATLIPTYFINKKDSLGSISKGKIADMVLLNKNPVTKLENLTEIALLFKNGYAISPDTLTSETPEMLVQRQWNAFNAKNAQAFLACFDPGIKVYHFPGSVLYKGITELKKNYASQLQNTSTTHCEVKQRIVLKDTVIDKVLMKEQGKVTREQVLVYKISHDKITGLYLVD